MRNVPQISVVVPVYNRRTLVRRAVGSLLDQDVDAAYEIVVVDDGSTDGSGEAVLGLHPRVRVLRQPNQGAPAARHNGVLESRAPVVAFLDSDDLAPPGKLSALWGALKAHPDCVASFGVTQRSDAPRGGADRWIEGPLDGRTVVVSGPFGRILGEITPIVGAMNLMTYRDLALSSSRDRSFYRSAEDYDFQLRLARHGNFVFVAAATCVYEPLADGVTGMVGTVRQEALSFCSAEEAFLDLEDRAGLKKTMRSRVEREWPRIAVGLGLRGDWKLLVRVVGIAARHARWWRSPRQFWWALDAAVETGPETVPACLAGLVKCGKATRARLSRRPSGLPARESL